MSKVKPSKSKPKAKPKGPQTYKLIHPFVWDEDEGEVTEIEFRRPKGKDLKKIKQGDYPIEETMKMASRLSDIPAPFFDELDGEDVVGIGELIDTFLPEPQKTGRGA